MARFDCALWRPIGANLGGGLSPNLGLVLHHAVASGSLWGFFNSPSAQVSAHFWVSRTGVIEQYADTDRVTWHGRNLNGRYVGVETEGCGPAPHAEPMTDAMLAAMGRLYGEGMRRHGWPASQANRDGERGLGFHRMAVATACPCDVRLEKRAEIIRLAQGGAAAPSPQPREETGNMLLLDARSGGYWVAFRDGAIHAYNGAPWLGGTNNSRFNPQGWPCVGIGARRDGDGYTLALDPGNRDINFYQFPYDGSARP